MKRPKKWTNEIGREKSGAIAATHVNLIDAVKAGKFREDLFYRIAKEVIQIPPIRDRIENIPEMVHYFLKTISTDRKPMPTAEAMHI